ncbi:MAG TPA: hypothetical protein VNW92_16345, partial [Polyangiaceae bacterium]|nr:hypothetical protein [Polyangiaceae bacterium]
MTEQAVLHVATRRSEMPRAGHIHVGLCVRVRANAAIAKASQIADIAALAPPLREEAKGLHPR